MNGTSPQQEQAPLSAQHFEFCIKQVAEHFSEVRRITNLFWENRRRLASIRDTSSSAAEMALDWRNACDFMSLKVIEGDDIDLLQLEPTSYPVLEDAWLQRVKEIKAYYIWEKNGSGNNDADYFAASNEIRKNLLHRERPPIGEFARVRLYIQESYLKSRSSDMLDDEKHATDSAIRKKAQRIYDFNHDPDDKANWHRAKLYASLFYENIIGAVEDKVDRLEKTLKVFRAFQFSKSPRNKYWIVNAFEAAVAINFLDRDTIRKILEKPAQYDFSMEPVDQWPSGHAAQFNNLSYDNSHKQLIYLGRMTAAEKANVLGGLRDEAPIRAVENLYQQSQLGPLKDMIL